jgi:hypothetical protein
MYGDEHPKIRGQREARERTLQGLSTAFARDELSMEEFERRVDAAFATTTSDELQALLSDLSHESKLAGGALATAEFSNDRALVLDAAAVPAPIAIVEPSDKRAVVLARVPRAVAIFGNVERRGPMTLAPQSRILSVFGNVEMDLRDAVLPDGGAELEVRVVFGNAEITVPPDWSVSCEGMGIFGSFASVHRVPSGESGTVPLLRITGTATFGNFEVHTMPRGMQSGLRRLPR